MFKFRLQSVLEVRNRITRIKQKEYSEVLARYQALEAQIAQHEEDIAKSGRKMDAAKRHSPDTFAMQQFTAYRQRLKTEIVLIGDQMREENQELEARRQALVEARRAQRSLEILQENALERYTREQNRRERVTMDEVASIYHAFRPSSN